MPISSSLSARLGPGTAPTAAPARWGPYARPSEPRRSGCAMASRPSLRLEPETARLLGPVRGPNPAEDRVAALQPLHQHDGGLETRRSRTRRRIPSRRGRVQSRSWSRASRRVVAAAVSLSSAPSLDTRRLLLESLCRWGPTSSTLGVPTALFAYGTGNLAKNGSGDADGLRYGGIWDEQR
ncbi:hypothetical protein ZWY2020_032664 [Hordeum vulgare]|nr:hypothetical protein ZWY2020_032664 [Hordeum vulgare]